MFEKGQKNGFGSYLYENGDVHEGEWKSDISDGEIDIIYKIKNETYKGSVLDGKRHGKGKMFFANGDKYSGDFINDNMEGTGEMIYASGDKYIGEFQNGFLDGKGEYIYTNEDRFIGQFKEGKVDIENGDFIESDKPLELIRQSEEVYQTEISGNIVNQIENQAIQNENLYDNKQFTCDQSNIISQEKELYGTDITQTVLMSANPIMKPTIIVNSMLQNPFQQVSGMVNNPSQEIKHLVTDNSEFETQNQINQTNDYINFPEQSTNKDSSMANVNLLGSSNVDLTLNSTILSNVANQNQVISMGNNQYISYMPNTNQGPLDYENSINPNATMNPIVITNEMFQNLQNNNMMQLPNENQQHMNFMNDNNNFVQQNQNLYNPYNNYRGNRGNYNNYRGRGRGNYDTSSYQPNRYNNNYNKNNRGGYKGNSRGNNNFNLMQNTFDSQDTNNLIGSAINNPVMYQNMNPVKDLDFKGTEQNFVKSGGQRNSENRMENCENMDFSSDQD